MTVWYKIEELLPNADEIAYCSLFYTGKAIKSNRVLAIDINGKMLTGFFIHHIASEHEYYGPSFKTSTDSEDKSYWIFGDYYENYDEGDVEGFCNFEPIAWRELPEGPHFGE